MQPNRPSSALSPMRLAYLQCSTRCTIRAGDIVKALGDDRRREPLILRNLSPRLSYFACEFREAQNDTHTEPLSLSWCVLLMNLQEKPTRDPGWRGGEAVSPRIFQQASR